MQIQALAISDTVPPRYQGASSYLINGSLVIDAGTVGLWGDPADQSAIEHVLLTHAHFDHVSTLPLFVDNCYAPGPGGPTIYGLADSLDAVQRQLFNGEIWPDFVAMNTPDNGFMFFEPLDLETPRTLAGLTVTPVAVDHGVTACGYIVQDDQQAVVFCGDSGPTTRIWDLANALAVPVRAVFMEASFPNAMGWLAQASFHLTPQMFAQEMDKLDGSDAVQFYAVHLKPRYRAQVADELAALGRDNLAVMQMNHPYDLS